MPSLRLAHAAQKAIENIKAFDDSSSRWLEINT